jgi:LysR family transcriptional regulator, transcriptional activator of the cysJI operon
METESLKLLLDIIKLKSFSKAATSNSLTQSAVSQRLKALEKRFGATLIERRGTDLRLTQAGQVVFDGSIRILAELREIEERLNDMRGKGGLLKVSVIYSVGLYELDPFVKKLLSRHPDIDVQIEYNSAKKIYQDIVNGTVDLGIVAYPSKHPKIQSMIFREDELVLICHPNHPLCGSEPIKISNIAAEPFITFHRETPTRKSLDRIMKERGVTPRIKAEFDNIELIKRAVEIGLGISIVPVTTVKTEVQLGLLKVVPIAEGPFSRPIAVVHRRGRSLRQAVRIFIDVLTAQ